eukprot:632630-Hanusia_phi.AAC.1
MSGTRQGGSQAIPSKPCTERIDSVCETVSNSCPGVTGPEEGSPGGTSLRGSICQAELPGCGAASSAGDSESLLSESPSDTVTYP